MAEYSHPAMRVSTLAPGVSARLKAAQERRARKRAAMERAWTEMVEVIYQVEEGLTSLHNRAARNGLAPPTIRALERAQQALAGAVKALEEDECLPRARPKRREIAGKPRRHPVERKVPG